MTHFFYNKFNKIKEIEDKMIVCIVSIETIIHHSRGAHGSGTAGYGLEPLVPVLEIVEPESNRDGVSRFRFRTGGFPAAFYSFEPSVFLRFRLDFTVFRWFFAVPVWNRPETTVLARFRFEIF